MIKALSMMLAVAFVSFGAASAPATTWVSHNGADSNTCGGQTTPCATFGQAVTNAGAGSVVSCLDSGDFGTANIFQSISIVCTGVTANTPRVLIIATNATVVLKGLTFVGVGSVSNAIEIGSAGTVSIADCRIDGYTTEGIIALPSSGTLNLFVTNSEIDSSGNAPAPSSPSPIPAGISIDPQNGASVLAQLSNVVLAGNANGIAADSSQGGGQILLVADHTQIGNSGTGIIAMTGSAASPQARVFLDHGSAINNSTAISVVGGGGEVLLDDSTITANVTGLSTSSGGRIFSYGNNRIDGDFIDGVSSIGTIFSEN